MVAQFEHRFANSRSPLIPLNRHSPDDRRSAMNIRVFRPSCNTEAWCASAASARPRSRALKEARAKGHRLVILVGDEPYCGKCGFRPIPPGRAVMPGPVDPARLLVAELVDGAF